MLYVSNAPVAQLDRALGYGPGGSGFKSERKLMKKILNINKIVYLILLSLIARFSLIKFMQIIH